MSNNFVPRDFTSQLRKDGKDADSQIGNIIHLLDWFRINRQGESFLI